LECREIASPRSEKLTELPSAFHDRFRTFNEEFSRRPEASWRKMAK
jgi:hypothetical protein